MSREWKLRVLGVRGAFPTPNSTKLTYGGNTSCFALDCGDTSFILDAGSGLSGYALQNTDPEASKTVNLLLGHLHLDHIIGLPLLPLMFDPNAAVNIYGPVGFKDHVDAVIRPPYWPVGFDDFTADISFHDMYPGSSIDIDDIHIDTMSSNHPNGGILYRISDKSKSLVYALDCATTDDIYSKLVRFCRDCDMIIWDANYTSSDIHPGWGHSTWEQGLGILDDSGAGRILMSHYDRDYTDAFIRTQEELCIKKDPRAIFAREGMILIL